jgi:hypothetical protein
MMMPITYHCHHTHAALEVAKNIVDGGAKFGGLLFDVGPSFSDGLFHEITSHLIGLVELSLMHGTLGPSCSSIP